MSRHPLLLVEDTAALARTYQAFLRDSPFDVAHVETGEAALEAIARDNPHLVLLDIRLPGISGLDVLRDAKAAGYTGPVVVVTADGSLGAAVEAMKLGAADFLVKPVTGQRLLVTLQNALEKDRLASEVKVWREKIAPAGFSGFVGESLAMQAVYRTLEAAAQSTATVFITGESGTGKELAAHAVHTLSKRAKGPFIPVNCAAIPGDLMESEIFGHVKGAFTGATGDKKGAAELADGGTLFLDEICEMDTFLQTKLLRFLQSGAITRVGDARPRKVDVRIVCATNRDPMREVEAGRFREDLYYRLHVIPSHLPPLREREEDVLRIAETFLLQMAGEEDKGFRTFSADARARLTAHAWPGNVRELQNVIRRAVVMNDGAELTAAMLPIGRPGAAATQPAAPTPAQGSAPTLGDLAGMIEPLETVERRAIERAISLCGGDVKKAAVFLSVSPATLYRKRKAWDAA